MNRSIEELKIRAKKLHKKAISGDPVSLRRMKLDLSQVGDFKRKTCLNFMATTLGFKDWGHAKSIISGTALNENNMGNLWYSDRCATLLNHWFSTYQDAKSFLGDNPQMYLLPYKNQYMVVTQDFIKVIDLYEGHNKTWDAISNNIVEHYNSNEWHKLVWHRIKTIN